MTRTRNCLKTACEARIEQCDAWLDSCTRDCDGIDDPYLNLACYDACNRHDCSCSDVDYELCDTWGYDFSLPQSRNGRVYAACARAAERNAVCGEPPLARDCDVAARVEDPERVDVYDCMAQTSCGSSLQACTARVPVGTLGTEYCATRAACGAGVDSDLECEPDEAASLDAASGWLGAAATHGARGCFEEACADVVACMTAWETAVGIVPRSSSAAPSDGWGGAGGSITGVSHGTGGAGSSGGASTDDMGGSNAGAGGGSPGGGAGGSIGSLAGAGG